MRTVQTMKTMPVLLGALTGTAMLSASGRLTAQTFPKTPPAAMALAPAQFPPFQEVTLANGMRLLVVENRKQPVISVSLSFAAGGMHDPANRRGVASMVAGLLNKGAGTRDADAFAAAIEGVGGNFSATADDDFLTIGVNALTRDAKLAFSLLGDAAQRPTFPDKEVELLRTQTLSGLQLERSQPASIASRLFARTVYGAHPYGQSADEASVKAIGRDDIVAFHRDRLRPQGALLVVAGAMDLATARQLAQSTFGSWTGAPKAAAAAAAAPTRRGRELLLVHRPGSVQSNVIIGNLTWSAADPRSYAATVANEVIGGGSEGRFFRILREQKGWTYGSYSSLTKPRGVGTFRATGEFRTEVTDSAVRVMLDEIGKLRTAPVEAKEFTERLGSLTGRFPLQVETAQQVAGRVAAARLLGLPANYVQTYRQRLAAITPAQAQGAARAAFRTDSGVILVVGDGRALYAKLKAIEPNIRVVDIEGAAIDPAELTAAPRSAAIDWNALTARTDSFTVLLQGNPFGYQKSSLVRNGDGWTYTENTVLGPIVNQQTTVMFGADGSPRATKQSGTMQGQAMSIDVAYAGGKATGKARTPGAQGMQDVTVNADVSAGTIDDNLVAPLLPLMPLKAGASIPFSVFQSGKGTTTTMTAKVEAEESVTVPAGTFKAFKLSMQGGEQPLTFWVSSEGQRQLLKIAFAGAPIEIVRVK